MKKALSIVLSVAMMMTCLFSMFVVPASALNGYDFLVEAGVSLSDEAAAAGATAEIVDGVFTFTATAAGQEASLILEGEANILAYPYWEVALETTARWDACLYSPADGKYMFAAGDWQGDWAGNFGSYTEIAPGTEDVKINVTGCYTWNGGSVPENAAVKVATFIARQPGTFTVTKCAMTDGISDVPLFPENNWDDLAGNWNNFEILAGPDRVADWIGSAPDKGGNSEIVVSYDEENWTMNFGNTAGNWPSASIEVNKKVDYYTSAIDVDLSVLAGASTTLYVFFGDATPDDFEGEGKAYGTILADVTAGNYYGTVMLSDILPEDSDVIDENGMVNVSYVKIFATSGNVVMDPAVVVNWIDLCYYEENPAPEGLGDIDLDDDVDTYDTLVCFSAAMDELELTEEEYDRADYDRDTLVTLFDALYIFCEASGLAPEDLA
ncbi:MAG: hypothetical protein E7553_07330 [Ruminococcaceae bacterium]|nr:hypothetical protein [Oscillospiraceae bacterium]